MKTPTEFLFSPADFNQYYDVKFEKFSRDIKMLKVKTKFSMKKKLHFDAILREKIGKNPY